MTVPAADLRREQRIVWVLAGIQFMHVLNAVIMMPLGPQLMRLFALSPRDFGILISVYMLAAAASGVMASAFTDRFDRRRILLVLGSGFVLALVGTASAPSYTLLTVAYATAGGFGGVMGMQVHAFVGDVVPDARRGRATGIVMSAFAAASVIGVPSGLLLADATSWRLPFACLAVAAVGLLAVAARVLPPLPPHGHAAGASVFTTWSRVLSEANHRRAFVLVFLLTFASFSVIPYQAPYMVRNVGLTNPEIALTWFCGGLATFFTSRWIGRQVDLHGKQRVFRAVVLASIVPLVVMTNLPPVPLVIAVLCATLFMSLVSGRYVPGMALVNAAARPGLRGSFLSLSGAVQQGAAGLATFVSGLIIGAGADGSLTHYRWVGVIAVLGTFGAVITARRMRAFS